MDNELDDLSPTTMTWREAEHLAAEHMRALGFIDAAATPLGTDQGLDVTAAGGVAQVKHFSAAPVGSPDVQRLRGAAHGQSRALFYALNGYTTAATTYAESAGVALFTYSLEREVTPVNRAAAALIDEGYIPVDFGASTTARDRVLAELTAYGQSTVDSITRLTNGIGALASDPEWVSRLTQEQYVENVEPAGAELVRLQQMIHTLNGEQPVGRIMTTIVQCEALAQRVAGRFGLDYDDFMPGGDRT